MDSETSSLPVPVSPVISMSHGLGRLVDLGAQTLRWRDCPTSGRRPGAYPFGGASALVRPSIAPSWPLTGSQNSSFLSRPFQQSVQRFAGFHLARQGAHKRILAVPSLRRRISLAMHRRYLLTERDICLGSTEDDAASRARKNSKSFLPVPETVKS